MQPAQTIPGERSEAPRPLFLVTLVLFLGWVSLVVFAADEEPLAVSSKTLLLVRHAETAADTHSSRDPELSEEGQARAVRLAELLAAAEVTHLFASEFRRTQATLAPLAERHELETAVRDARHSAELAAELRRLPGGSVAVVSGHSNTIPALARSLGASLADLDVHPQAGPILAHHDYGRLFVLTLEANPERPPVLLELRY